MIWPLSVTQVTAIQVEAQNSYIQQSNMELAAVYVVGVQLGTFGGAILLFLMCSAKQYQQSNLKYPSGVCSWCAVGNLRQRDIVISNVIQRRNNQQSNLNTQAVHDIDVKWGDPTERYNISFEESFPALNMLITYCHLQ